MFHKVDSLFLTVSRIPYKGLSGQTHLDPKLGLSTKVPVSEVSVEGDGRDRVAEVKDKNEDREDTVVNLKG